MLRKKEVIQDLRISDREGSGERITIVNKEIKAVGTIWGFVGAKRRCL